MNSIWALWIVCVALIAVGGWAMVETWGRDPLIFFVGLVLVMVAGFALVPALLARKD